MKKGAIFDMDGLLFDTERLYRDSGREMAARFGQTFTPRFGPALCGTSGQRSLEVIREHYPAVDPEAFLAAIVEGVQQRLKESVPVKPGAVELLAFLQERGVKLAVASSSIREMVVGNLERAGVAAYFSVVASGQDVERGKPEPDIFLLAAKRLGLAPGDCYVFEDGINGCHAGLAAGCKTVMVPDLTPPTDELRERCAAVCASLFEVRGRIAAGTL